NHFLNDRTKGEKYATVFYCTLDQNGMLKYANAGHPNPVIVRASGDILSLETTGMPLGMLGIATYDAKEVQLERGDKVVLFSDGLSEAENSNGEFFDRKALRPLLRANAALNSSELHAKLVGAVDRFTEGATLADDITVLVLEYLPN